MQYQAGTPSNLVAEAWAFKGSLPRVAVRPYTERSVEEVGGSGL